MIPAAKPKYMFGPPPFFPAPPPRTKKTVAAPRQVIKKMNPVPPAAQSHACIKPLPNPVRANVSADKESHTLKIINDPKPSVKR
jgi:hypothetical protein